MASTTDPEGKGEDKKGIEAIGNGVVVYGLDKRGTDAAEILEAASGKGSRRDGIRITGRKMTGFGISYPSAVAVISGAQ